MTGHRLESDACGVESVLGSTTGDDAGFVKG
jgi:hypothetical protein